MKLSPKRRVEERRRGSHTRARPRSLRIAALLGAPLVFLGVCSLAGLRLNLTGSLPLGLYVVARGAPEHGALVLVCLPATTAEWARSRDYIPRGAACPGKAMPVGKPVFALPGDTVTVAEAGLLLNGRLAANSRPLGADHHGRPLRGLPAGRYVVRPGELWVVSQYSPFSFDSRYFGAVPIANIRTRIRLIWAVHPLGHPRRSDATFGEPAQVKPPWHLAPQLPHVEHQVDIVFGSRGSPAVDLH